MRKVIYGGACSLDGFMAGPYGEIDWLHFSKDVQTDHGQQRGPAADTMLFGRKTWEGAAQQGGGGATKPGVTGYVFSRTLTSDPGRQRRRAGARGSRRVRPRPQVTARQGHHRDERRQLRERR